jgi:hypothetical protein
VEGQFSRRRNELVIRDAARLAAQVSDRRPVTSGQGRWF